MAGLHIEERFLGTSTCIPIAFSGNLVRCRVRRVGEIEGLSNVVMDERIKNFREILP